MLRELMLGVSFLAAGTAILSQAEPIINVVFDQLFLSEADAVMLVLMFVTFWAGLTLISIGVLIPLERLWLRRLSPIRWLCLPGAAIGFLASWLLVYMLITT